MNFNFTGKVVLITGASSGIGAGTAELFSKCGASLVLTGRNETKLKEVCTKCTDVSPNKLVPLMITAELSDEDQTEKLVEKTIQECKQIDILINNAGMVILGSIEETTLEDFDKLMDVNLRTIFQLTKLCIPHLVKTEGNIVNTSSVTGLRSFSGINTYCVSKSGLDHFTRCSALELASRGVRVNAVNPGVIRTEIHTKAGRSKEDYNKFLERCKVTHALGRAGEVNEVASAIVFLASHHASFITGVTLSVDGGRHVMCPR